MSVPGWLLASGIATALLTITITGSQLVGLTRMSFALMLGTMFTDNRDRALVIGTAVHFALGFGFGALYAICFEWFGEASWWVGAIGGALHGALVLLVALPILPGLHPRMATDNYGPEPTRGLEPPGPLGRNYGYSTAIFVGIGHIIYGAVLGGLYRPG